MENFTPVSALIGGALIGLGTLLLLVGLGRIAGISGITSTLLFQKEDKLWRLAFVLGLVAGPLLTTLFYKDFSYSTPSLAPLRWPRVCWLASAPLGAQVALLVMACAGLAAFRHDL